MNTILLPTDFSPASTNALHYAAALAQDIQASLMIVHVYQIPVSMTEVPVAAISIDQLKAQTEEQLEQLKTSLSHLFPNILKVYTEAVMGNITDELTRITEKIQPLALVMGSQGSSDMEHFLMGSTTLTTIRNIPYPIFVIPPGVHYRKIEKVGLACDMKEIVASFPIEKFKKLTASLKGKYYVLNVNDQRTTTDPSFVLENAYLETLFEGIPHEYHFLQKTEISSAINEFAELNNLDLLIMIPKKHHWFELLIQKSTAADLLKHSHIPLLSIKTTPAS